MPTAPDRPLRVVVFGSGPRLNPDVEEFLCRLDEHPEIELLVALIQAPSRSWYGVIRDLWRRRGLLALPLLISRLVADVGPILQHPRLAAARRRRLGRLAGQIRFVPDIHAPAVIEAVRSLAADLGLIYGSPILRPALFMLPRLGTLGIHHGKLPEYRGNKTAFWAMYNGEPAAGVTIQQVNAGLDAGAIVKEGTVPTLGRSYAAVVRDLEALGLELYLQAILEVKHGTAIPRSQPGLKGRLYRNPTLRDFLIFGARQLKRRWRRTPARNSRSAPGA